MAGQQDFFGQLWKEYAMSDSRYLTSDPFVLCMESVTAVCFSLSPSFFLCLSQPAPSSFPQSPLAYPSSNSTPSTLSAPGTILPLLLTHPIFTKFAWGPLCFLTAYLILADSAYRLPVQALVSTGQCYGDVLYYLTNYFNQVHFGITYSRPEAYYFWGYYVFMNFWWIAIPGCKSRFAVPSITSVFAR